MNLVAVVAFGLILICCNVPASNTNIMKNVRNKMLESFLKKFKIMLRTGNSTLGIPVVDPFNADQLNIKLNEEIIKIKALMTKVNVNGLSEYDIINHDCTVVSKVIVLNFHLSWPLIVATTNYAMKGNVEFEIYGTGEIRTSMQNFALNMTIDLIMDGGLTGYLKIEDIKLKFSIKSLDLHATGLYQDNRISEILSALISEMAPELISDDKIVHDVVLLIRKSLDDFLSTKTVLDLMTIFNLINVNVK